MTICGYNRWPCPDKYKIATIKKDSRNKSFKNAAVFVLQKYKGKVFRVFLLVFCVKKHEILTQRTLFMCLFAF